MIDRIRYSVYECARVRQVLYCIRDEGDNLAELSGLGVFEYHRLRRRNKVTVNRKTRIRECADITTMIAATFKISDAMILSSGLLRTKCLI